MSIRFNVATERKSQLISRCLDSVGSKMGTEPVTNQKSHWLKKCTKTINLFFFVLYCIYPLKTAYFLFPCLKCLFVHFVAECFRLWLKTTFILLKQRICQKHSPPFRTFSSLTQSSSSFFSLVSF